jgi:hypothetical protein
MPPKILTFDRAPLRIPAELRPPRRCPACGTACPCPAHPRITEQPWKRLKKHRTPTVERRGRKAAGKPQEATEAPGSPTEPEGQQEGPSANQAPPGATAGRTGAA